MKIKALLVSLAFVLLGSAIAPAQYLSSKTYMRPVHIPQRKIEQVNIPLSNGNRFQGNRETVDGVFHHYNGTFYYADGAKVISEFFDANYCIPNDAIFWFATADNTTLYKRVFRNGIQVDLNVYNTAGQSWMILNGQLQFLDSAGSSYSSSGSGSNSNGSSYSSGSSSSGSSSSRIQCPSCHGSTKCSHCNGEGRLKSNIIGQGYYTCSVCNGRKICTHCHGRGTVR